ncbi:MAG: ABC transporter permease [Bacteroidetes bacterium]|nr:ABC transporter permease [Bacteroidota bacterium]
MKRPYSQFRASLAVAKASLLSMLRSPTAVVFSLVFPIVFIIVFGSMVDTNEVRVPVAFAPGSDTSGLLYKSIEKIRILKSTVFPSPEKMQEALDKGRIAAIISIRADSKILFIPHFQVQITTSNASADKSPVVRSAIRDVITEMDNRLFQKNFSIAKLEIKNLPGRIYRSIDFILPGQLGFSLLMAGVFGSAFLLFNLRQGLVLKRFFATPINRTYLIIGEMLSRLLFQVIGFIIMVSLGYFLFGFTLVNGIFTFSEMLLLSIFGLIIFAGIGFIVSGVLENESSIAPVANTVTLPQILLCGLFFPVENYPAWLQSFCKLLPLTIFVDGLRKIAFEGVHIWQMPFQIGGLLCWAVIISIFAIKLFRWE